MSNADNKCVVDLQKQLQEALRQYAAKDKAIGDEEWLNNYFIEQLPEMPEEERKASSVAILTTI